MTRVSHAAVLAFIFTGLSVFGAESKPSTSGWRQLPLIKDGKIDPNWVHVGYGGFVVENDTLKTACDPKGLGLLVYKKERLGDCQIKLVFKAKEPKSNSGVYVRLDDGILSQVGKAGPAFQRDAQGNPSEASLEKVKAAAERETGAWFAVHRGYEVQICDEGDGFHRTGAVYSLAPSTGVFKKPPSEWRTMIITLAGEKVSVELDGEKLSEFDPTAPGLPERKQWYEPKRKPRRPQAGYIGLQNHDPGDVVWFREVSVRPLPGK
jgi:hypothetical protein